MKIIHIADLHANKVRYEYCEKILEDIKKQCKENTVILITGDFWDSMITATDNSKFTSYIKLMKELSDIAEIYMIYGTSSHEPDGSLDVFKLFGIHVFNCNTVFDAGSYEIIAIPEPRKVNYIGKENVSTQIKEDLSNFIKKCGKKNKIRIVMYHGDIVGATYQNSIQVGIEEGSYALTPGQLKQLQADYYACGHIHKPQEVFKNCWYAGSAIPKDFGELHEGGYNEIFISDTVRVERKLFDIPQNVVHSVNFENIESLKKMSFQGKRLLVKILMNKSLKKTFNTEALRKEVMDSTGAVYVKLNFSYEEKKSIRDEKVAAEKQLSEKFKIYADINEIKYSAATVEWLKKIQDEMFIEKFIPCDTFELEYLSLRGAIGIKDGIGKDDIIINFSDYKDGILGLVGTNGSGKTTIIENCHPFPQMLTRSGTLKDHFCLKDSHRILIYRTSSGKRIRISMLIDGAAKCIGTRYFVEIKDSENGGWNSYRACDGSFAAYDSFVKKTFGTVELFLRTSFYAKEQIKGIPDLSYATKSEKMALFSLLAGTDYISAISEKAKEILKKKKEEIDKIKSNLKDFDNIEKRLDEAQENINKIPNLLSDLEAEKNAKQTELEDCLKRQAEFDVISNSYETTHRNLIVARNQKELLDNDLLALTNNISQLQSILVDKPLREQQRKWIKSNFALKIDLENNKKTLLAEKTKKNTALLFLTDIKDSTVKQLAELGKQKEVLKAKIKYEENSIPAIIDTCPTCGQELSQEKKDSLLKKIEEKKSIIASYYEALDNLSKKEREINVNETNEKITIYKKEITDIENRIFTIISDIDSINAYMDSLDKNLIDYTLDKADNELEELKKKKTSVIKNIKELERTIKELEEKESYIPEDFSIRINTLKHKIYDIENENTELKALLSISQRELEKLSQFTANVASIKIDLQGLKEDCFNLELLQKAFGNDGILAFELDSAAPEISDITNSILKESCGDRFSVSFETQRNGVNGKKIDDFIINVFDEQSGRVKKLDQLCSGESVWIKQALYYAFSVIRIRRSGFCFRTRFLDESDGSLDSEARSRLLKMIEVAHKSCNATLTVLITHSQEIKDVLQQKLDLNAL